MKYKMYVFRACLCTVTLLSKFPFCLAPSGACFRGPVTCSVCDCFLGRVDHHWPFGYGIVSSFPNFCVVVYLSIFWKGFLGVSVLVPDLRNE